MELEDAYHQSGLYSYHEQQQPQSQQNPTATPPPAASGRSGSSRSCNSTNTSKGGVGSGNTLSKWRQVGSPPPPGVGRGSGIPASGSGNSGIGRWTSGRIPAGAAAAGAATGGVGITEEGDYLSEGEEQSWLEPPSPARPNTTNNNNNNNNNNSLMETSTTTTTTVDSAAGLVQSNSQPSGEGGTTLNCLGLGSKEPKDESDCGLFSFRPSFLQPLANIKIFVLLLSILVMVQQALASGYLNSVITTIEKRYEIPSYLTGVISSFYEIGNVITVIFVSYLGSRRRIPVWIAVGCLVMGLGSMLFVVPQLAAERWSIHGPKNANDSESDNICRSARVRDDTSEIFSEIGFGTLPDLSKGLGHSNGLQYTQRDNCIEGNTSNVFPVFFFVIAQLLLGAGGSPLLTLGTTYIDDHVKKESSSMYIGIIYTMVAFGPVLGFLLGGYLLSYYVDSFFVDDFNYAGIDHKHSRWIGMWWGGFLICGLLLLLLSVPFFMFPKTIKKEKEKVRLEEKTKEFQKGHRRTKSQTSTCSRHSTLSTKRVYGKDVRDIPMSMLKLLVNPIYVMTCLGACMELIIVSGFVVFLPKYLETQFSISNVQASIFTGGIAIPGACIGTFLGGYLLKRLSLRPKGAIQMVMAFNLMGLSLYGLLFVLGCDNVKMAGTTSPYFNSSLGVSSMPQPSGSLGGGSGPDAFKVNLTAWCNLGCSCRSNLVEPVCGNNGLTYFSPCHAGCSSSSAHNFLNCSCILGDPGIDTTPSSVDSSSSSGGGFLEVTAVPVATAGPCYIPCNTIKPFMVLLFFMSSAVAISQMPLLMIVLRSVDEEERSFALGVQFVIFRLIAYIPAPIMFGSVIDSTCLLWKTSCDGEKGGRCLLYDIEEFRYRYVGICTAIKIISAVIFLFDWLLIRWKYKLDMDGTMTVGDIVNSLMSVDKVISEEDEVEENVWLAELQGTQQGVVSPHGANAGSQVQLRSGSFASRPHATSQSTTSGHKRSHSGTHLPSSRPWASQHRRSHSSCGYQPITGQPVYGILATQPGHQRRASAGQQVTFRGLADDPGDLTGVRVMIQGVEESSTADFDHSPVKV